MERKKSTGSDCWSHYYFISRGRNPLYWLIQHEWNFLSNSKISLFAAFPKWCLWYFSLCRIWGFFFPALRSGHIHGSVMPANHWPLGQTKIHLCLPLPDKRFKHQEAGLVLPDDHVISTLYKTTQITQQKICGASWISLQLAPNYDLRQFWIIMLTFLIFMDIRLNGKVA